MLISRRQIFRQIVSNERRKPVGFQAKLVQDDGKRASSCGAKPAESLRTQPCFGNTFTANTLLSHQNEHGTGSLPAVFVRCCLNSLTLTHSTDTNIKEVLSRSTQIRAFAGKKQRLPDWSTAVFQLCGRSPAQCISCIVHRISSRCSRSS